MKAPSQGGFLIAKVHQAGGRVFAKLLKSHRLTEINPAQGRILFVLWQEDDIPIRDLAARTGLDKSTLTSMLDRLEKSGFVGRVPSPDDRRKILIRRTDKDRSYQDRYTRVSRAMTDLFYKGFSDEEIKDFESYLVRLLENLRGHETMMKRAIR